jgi:hypothetical protein
MQVTLTTYINITHKMEKSENNRNPRGVLFGQHRPRAHSSNTRHYFYITCKCAMRHHEVLESDDSHESKTFHHKATNKQFLHAFTWQRRMETTNGEKGILETVLMGSIQF